MAFSLKNCGFELLHLGKHALGYGRHLLELAASRKFRAIRLSGPLPESNIAIKILYLGNAEKIAPVRDFFFDDVPQSEDLGPVHAFVQRRNQARLITPGIDAIATTRLPLSPRPAPGTFVTTTLTSILPLPPTMDELLASLPETERRKLKQALKAGFEVETGESENDYRDFHEHMFGPLMIHRHGEKAFVAPLERLLAQANRSSLIFLKQDGKRVGGILLRWPRINGTHALPHFDKIGIIDDISRDATQLNRVNVALYHQMFAATIQRRYPRISLGVVPPLLNSGLLRFKARWGSNLHVGSHEFDFYRHAIVFCSEKQHEIKTRRNIIHVNADGTLTATLGVKQEVAGTPDLESMLKGRRIANIEKINLHFPDGRVATRGW